MNSGPRGPKQTIIWGYFPMPWVSCKSSKKWVLKYFINLITCLFRWFKLLLDYMSSLNVLNKFTLYISSKYTWPLSSQGLKRWFIGWRSSLPSLMRVDVKNWLLQVVLLLPRAHYSMHAHIHIHFHTLKQMQTNEKRWRKVSDDIMRWYCPICRFRDQKWS